VGGSGRQVRVTFATKNAKVVVGGHGAKEGSVWCGEPERLGGQNVEKVGGCLQSFDPVGGWKGGLKQKAAHNIVERPNEALSLTVLRRGVGTGHDMRRCMPWVRKNVRELELSNSLPLSH